MKYDISLEDRDIRQTSFGPAVPSVLLVRLRAKIARRPGRWRRRMQPRNRRKRQEDAEAA